MQKKLTRLTYSQKKEAERMYMELLVCDPDTQFWKDRAEKVLRNFMWDMKMKKRNGIIEITEANVSPPEK